MAQQELPRDVRSDSNNIINNTNIPSIIVPNITCPPPPPYPTINLPPGHPASIINDRGAPPSYEEVIDRNAPPPSYESLFGRMIEAQKICKGVVDFVLNIVVLLLGTIGCTIIFGVTIAVPLSMMIIGGMYLYDCPQGEYIPVYLLVAGGFAIFKQLLYLSARVRQWPDDRDEERIRQSPTLTLINCFMLGWFIIGSMWVYKEYEPNYDPSLGKYCNKTLYLFAFWLITLVYIFLGILTVGLCCISVITITFQSRPLDRLMSI
ncbi:transmembrane protein 272-like [Chelonus insularis]|uniref:transmembrane protein 272-like n=1 Tax=Chelonus insularis TaxID=460826 RepID=UPI00158E84DA|nr:transmembrane protein 272-like [Chelonus insularis]